MHWTAGNASDPIWRVLASYDRISSCISLKPQHSNPNPNRLANQLWYIDFLTPPTPLIISHRLPAFLESLMPLKNSCSIHARCFKSSLKHSIRFFGIFCKFKTEFIAYRSSKVSSRPDRIFEIHQLCQSGFSRVYSNCCWFEPEIIKIGQSFHKMYCNNIVNFQESTTILNSPTKKSLETYWRHHVYSNCCCSCWFEPEIIKIGQSSHKMYCNNVENFQESTIILNACTKMSGNLLNEPRSSYLCFFFFF